MEFGMFGFYFWFCPLPKNHLLCLSCVWLVVPYLRGLIVTTSLLQTGLRSVCTASPADSSTGSLSVVCCSALLTRELKSPACCLSSSLSLGLFGSIRALLQELEDVCPSLLWPPSRASLGSKRMDRLEPWMPSWRVLTPCSCSTRAACSRASLWQKTHSSCGLCWLLSFSFKPSLTWCWKLSRCTCSHPVTSGKTFLFHLFLGRRI